jgi:hypothetical protein
LVKNDSKTHQGSQVTAILLVFASIFLLIFLFIMLIFLPVGKDYKAIKTENRKVELELKTLEQKNSQQVKILNELKIANKNIINSFSYPSDNLMLIKKLKFIESMQLVKDDNSTYEKFSKRTYQVNTINAPNTLVDFFVMLQKPEAYHRIFDLDFPIVFEKNRRDLKISFLMNTYRLKYVPKKEIKTASDIENIREKIDF